MNTTNTGKHFNTSQFVILGLMTAILLLMAFTPLGYLNIGPLAITFNVIPVAISAISLGPAGGAFTGAVFGLTSFFQCLGIGGFSAFGAFLFNINPVLTFLMCFVPRFADGLLLGYIFRWTWRVFHTSAACLITGFFSAFLNTVLFTSAMVLFFGHTDYLQEMIGGRNLLVFMCTFVGVNAVCEMIVSTILTGAVGMALFKAKFISAPHKAQLYHND